MALFPDAVAQHAQFFEQFAHQRGLLAGNRNVVRGPGIGGDFVFTPAGVAAGLLLHFEQHEVVEAALIEPPCGAQSGDAAADDDERNS